MNSDSNPSLRSRSVVCFFRALLPESNLRHRLQEAGAVVLEKHGESSPLQALASTKSDMHDCGPCQRLVVVLLHSKEIPLFVEDSLCRTYQSKIRVVSANPQVTKNLKELGQRVDAQAFEVSEVALYIAIQSLL